MSRTKYMRGPVRETSSSPTLRYANLRPCPGLTTSGLLSWSRFTWGICVEALQSMFLFRRGDDCDSIAPGGNSQSCDVTKSERAKVRDSRPTGNAATPSIKNRVHGTKRGAIRHPRNIRISGRARWRFEKRLILKWAFRRRPE